MADACKGDFVQVHKVVLKTEQRPEHLPPSTKTVPYEGWIKGFLIDEEGNVGDEVRIRTFIGREIGGTLCQVNPVYDHGKWNKHRTPLVRIRSLGLKGVKVIRGWERKNLWER